MMLLILLSVHFVADFVLQTDWMALNKSKNVNALLVHCAVYAACFLPFGVSFACVTFMLHSAQDSITSRLNGRLWQANERHWFFVGIGADQLLHAWQLGVTYSVIGGVGL